MTPRKLRMGWLAAALAVAAGTTLPGCRPRSADDARPVDTYAASASAWLDQLIRQLERDPVANPPASVYRYRYKGQTVYYVPPRCCDVPSDVYDAQGRLLCHPEGGITGRGDGRCSDFVAERGDERLVWRDPRSPSP